MYKNKRDKDFSKLPHIIVTEILAHMSGKDIKIYLTLNRFANYSSGIAFPSVRLISKVSGVSKNDIRKTVDRLVSAGLILTCHLGKERSFSKYYGIVKREFIDVESAVKALARPEGPSITIVRGANGRFMPIPVNQEQPCPENTEQENPRNTDTAIPQTVVTESEDADKKEKLEVETISRNRGIDEGKHQPDARKAKPCTDIRAYCSQEGFFKAMELMYGSDGFQKATSSDDFDRLEEERIQKAKEFFDRKK